MVANIEEDNQPIINDAEAAFFLCTLALPPSVPYSQESSSISQGSSFVRLPTSVSVKSESRVIETIPCDQVQRETIIPTKGKISKINGTVPIEEMVRLMRVYGPIKSLRNRTPNSGDALKPNSIVRKFYRWFPNFNDRFEQTSWGWFMPKCGHEHEMKYRMEMRTKDQEVTQRKRVVKKKLNRLNRP